MSFAFLIEPEVLRAQQDVEQPLIIDARTPAAYAAGHLPGACFLSTYDCFVPDTSDAGMAAFAREVAARYAAIGVTRERPVVVYEDETGMRAARELWILEYLGHENVRMLHGGLAGWRAAGGSITIDSVMTQPTEFQPAVRDRILIGSEEIRAELGRPGRAILDVRDAREYAGRDDTPCCERRGRLPGAHWTEWTEFLEGGRYKSPEAIRELLRNRGIADDAELVPYCHRGARSANTYYALRYAGYSNVRNFIGSWHEWSARAELPLEIGLSVTRI